MGTKGKGWLSVIADKKYLLFTPLVFLLINWFISKLHGWFEYAPWIIWFSDLVTSKFTSSFFPSFCASLMFAWGVYVFRGKVRGWLELKPLTIRAPLMLGVAPLIVAKTEYIWQENNLNVDIDFRYAGRAALDDLKDEKCTFAVASDAALCSFAESQGDGAKLKMFPIVCITDHLKLLVREADRPSDGSLENLKGKRIGYFKDSIHSDFLKALGLLEQGTLFEMESVLDCYRRLAVEKDVDIVVLWEPHYCALKSMAGIVAVDNSTAADEFKWCLCLVARADFLAMHPQIANSVLSAVVTSASHCSRHLDAIAEACSPYLHFEFTGIGMSQLKDLMNSKRHHFGVNTNLNALEARLIGLGGGGGEFGQGAVRLKTALWPGLQWSKDEAN